jgi:uncharacterized membrane protein
MKHTHVTVTVLPSLLACGMLAGHYYLSDSRGYVFMAWNLFLAWIPYWSSQWAAHTYRRNRDWPWLLVIPAGLWLLFLPNAPYMITDLVHLYGREPFVLWYDVGLLMSFALAGCLLAVTSLRVMHTLVQQLIGDAAAWLFILASIGLSGIGVYIGRFLRWNSWDLLVNPKLVIADVLSLFFHPVAYPRAVGVTVMVASILFICYLAFATPPEQYSYAVASEES